MWGLFGSDPAEGEEALAEGQSLAREGRWLEARSAFAKAAKILRKANHARLSEALEELSLAELHSGNPDAARRHAGDLLSMIEARLPADEVWAIKPLSSAGQALWHSGDQERGLHAVERALEIATRMNDPNLPALQIMLATILADSEAHAEAIEMFTRVADACSGSPIEAYRGYAAVALGGLVGAYAAMGAAASAEEAFVRAERAYIDCMGASHPETVRLRQEMEDFRKGSRS